MMTGFKDLRWRWRRSPLIISTWLAVSVEAMMASKLPEAAGSSSSFKSKIV